MNERKDAWTARCSQALAALLVAVLCIATPVALTGCGANGSADKAATTETTGAATSDSSTADQVTVTQQIGADEAPEQVTVAKDGTVLDVLKASNIAYKTEDSSYGEYVTSIDGTASDATHGWTYTVNGKQPDVGAGDYKVADGDAVVWTYVEYTS